MVHHRDRRLRLQYPLAERAGFGTTDGTLQLLGHSGLLPLDGGSVMAREPLGPMDASIGRHLHKLRLEAGISEQRVAQELGVRQQLVSRQERGRSRLSVGQLLRLAALYGRTLAQLTVELALDDPAPQEAREPEPASYEAGSTARSHGTDGEFAREPFLLNLVQLRNRAERQAVLDLFNRFAQAQNA